VRSQNVMTSSDVPSPRKRHRCLDQRLGPEGRHNHSRCRAAPVRVPQRRAAPEGRHRKLSRPSKIVKHPTNWKSNVGCSFFSTKFRLELAVRKYCFRMGAGWMPCWFRMFATLLEQMAYPRDVHEVPYESQTESQTPKNLGFRYGSNGVHGEPDSRQMPVEACALHWQFLGVCDLDWITERPDAESPERLRSVSDWRIQVTGRKWLPVSLPSSPQDQAGCSCVPLVEIPYHAAQRGWRRLLRGVWCRQRSFNL